MGFFSGGPGDDCLPIEYYYNLVSKERSSFDLSVTNFIFLMCPLHKEIFGSEKGVFSP